MADSSFFNLTLSEPSKFRINTQYFSPYDLNLFVESIETINRLKAAKKQRKEREHLQILKQSPETFYTLPRVTPARSLNSTYSSIISHTDDEVEELRQELVLLENENVRKSPVPSEKSDYDECYFSAPNSSNSSPNRHCFCQPQLYNKHNQSMVSILTTTDSEESGVFATNYSKQNLYSRQTTSMKKSSPSFTTKVCFINLKKKVNSKESSNVKLISHRPLEEYETLRMYKQHQKQQNKLLPPSQKSPFFYTTFRMKRKSHQGAMCRSAATEERFLDKALRYLTL